MKQTSLFQDEKSKYRPGTLIYKLDKQKIYGGQITYRKISRPLEQNKPIHIVFRINKHLALSLRKNTSTINSFIFNYTKHFKLKNYGHTINSNHIHLIVTADDTRNIGRFLRAFTGKMSLHYKKLGLKTKLWAGRPFTKVASWGNHFKTLKSYITKNFKEVVGFSSYTPRKNNNYYFLKKFDYG